MSSVHNNNSRRRVSQQSWRKREIRYDAVNKCNGLKSRAIIVDTGDNELPDSMATGTPHDHDFKETMLESSDYGSDFGEDGEELLAQLLGCVEVQSAARPIVQAGNESVEKEHDEDRIVFPLSRRLRTLAAIPQPLQDLPWSTADMELAFHLARRGPSIEVEYDTLEPITSARPTDDSPGRIRFAESAPAVSSTQQHPSSETTTKDVHSPLQRFRTKPKKPLSVTDLVSPAWCEMQYLFNLSRFGRKPATPAMKRGSSVHKVLEEEVYETVQVDVRTREDHWGLRLWNIVQGLRTLRVTGMTRELEVWGVIDGEVVNGVIDELGYNCTDAALEARLSGEAQVSNDVSDAGLGLGNDQTTIQDFFRSQRELQTHQPNTPLIRSPRKIYLTDIKTRTHPTLPRLNSTSLRPTHMQLMLYRRLVLSIASNAVDPSVLFRRYDLDFARPFSDELLATLAQLDMNFRQDATEASMAPVEHPVDTVDELLENSNLIRMWGLMIREWGKTIGLEEQSLSSPDPTYREGGRHPTTSSPADASTSEKAAAQVTAANQAISPILKVEFRASSSGSILGSHTFAHDSNVLEAYVADEMRWWKGERAAKGVDVEEAFKCGICQFAEGCDWRKERAEEAVERSRARSRSGHGANAGRT